MKHVFTLFFLLLAGLAYGQESPYANGNPLQELRETYSTLDASRITTGVLMDQVVPLSRPQYFAGQGDSAANWQSWQQQYHEFYNASLTQTTLPLLQKIRDEAIKKLDNGTVPLLMLRYDYNQIRSGMAQDGYITLDSVNSRVYDGPDVGDTPYETKSLFSVALAIPSGCDNISLYIGSEFWFGNKAVPSTLKIDLGGGAGWQTVSMGSTVQLAMGISGPAKRLIKVQLPGSTINATTALARCAPLAVAPDLALGLLASRTWSGYTGYQPNLGSQTPRNWLGPAKAIAWIKYAPSNWERKIRRPLVFVEGIDFETHNGGGTQVNYPVQRTAGIPLSSTNFLYISGAAGAPACISYRNGSAGWNEMVNYNAEYKSLEKLPELRQQLQAPAANGGGDYDIIYLDFSDGAGLIQHNAMVLVELLEWINKPVNRTVYSTSEETLLIGASMGGQVARFALSWMEQQGLCHNTRLYVSVDSPHRGANIPLGLQNHIVRLAALSLGAEKQVVYSLQRPATLQMMVYHYNDNMAAPYRNQWQGWQNSAGSYPSLLRKVAAANGSGNATFPPNRAPGQTMVSYRSKPSLGISYALPGVPMGGNPRVVYWWRRFISLSGNTQYVNAPAGTGNYDTAPGSSTDAAQSIALQSDGDLIAIAPSTTFMPAISTLGVHASGVVMSPNFGYNITQQIPESRRADRSKYAFDGYYVPNTNQNEPHVQITNGQPSQQGNPAFLSNSSAWILNELRESQIGPWSANSVYNYGSPFRLYLPSMTLNSPSIVYFNNGNLPASGGTPASRVVPPAGRLEFYTSGCGSRVEVNRGAQFVLGQPGNTHTAEVKIGNKSLLDVREGGEVTVYAGSVLRLQLGSTLLVRNGATLRVDGQVIIDNYAYLCIESGANLVFSPGSTLSIGNVMAASASPYNPGALNCTTQVSVCGAFSSYASNYQNVVTRNEALRFDGSTQAVLVPVTSPSYVHNLSTEFTVEAFIRPELVGASAPNGAQTILSTRSNASGPVKGLLLTLFTSGGTTYLLTQLDGMNYGFGQPGTVIPADGRCHHVAVVRVASSNDLQFFIDGEMTYVTTVNRSAAGGGALKIGGDNLYGSWSESYRGSLGELRVWNSARLDIQINTSRSRKLTPVPQNGLVAYYDFQEAAGSQQVTDGSGVNPPVTGSLVNNPTRLTVCQLVCDVQGNYRAAPTAGGLSLYEGIPNLATGSVTDTMGQASNRNALRTTPSASRQVLAATVAPNPATGQATLHLTLDHAANVRVRLLDLSGKERRELLNQRNLVVGKHHLPLALQNLPPGLYLLSIDAGAGQQLIRFELQ